MKKERGKRKFSKLAILSFVLVCIFFITYSLARIDEKFLIFSPIVGIILIPASLIISIISLILINKHNLRGAILAYISLGLSIMFLIIIFYLIWAFSHML